MTFLWWIGSGMAAGMIGPQVSNGYSEYVLKARTQFYRGQFVRALAGLGMRPQVQQHSSSTRFGHRVTLASLGPSLRWFLSLVILTASGAELQYEYDCETYCRRGMIAERREFEPDRLPALARQLDAQMRGRRFAQLRLTDTKDRLHLWNFRPSHSSDEFSIGVAKAFKEEKFSYAEVTCLRRVRFFVPLFGAGSRTKFYFVVRTRFWSICQRVRHGNLD